MTRRFVSLLLAALLLLGASAASALAGGGYDLTWNTVDGGGATFSTGGTYSLGGFGFAGGVWLALASTLYKKVEAATAPLAQLPVSPDDPAPDAGGAAGIADPSDIGCTLAQAAAFEAVSRVGGALFGEGFERAVSGVSALDGARSMGAGSGFFC